MKKILLQGDSITDADRDKLREHTLGTGYAAMLGGELMCKNPTKYSVCNRGVSGNRVVDLYARWKKDCLNLTPDYLSILIGVNDVWHEISDQNGVEVSQYEKIYDMLLEETKAALPKCNIMLLEPFVMCCGEIKNHWTYFNQEVKKRAQVTEKLAKKHGAVFVPLQSVFDDAITKTPVEWWTTDGVHPTPAGHNLIAQQWLKAFSENFVDSY